MAINFFEGGRRIAKLLAALWAIGVVAVFASDGMPAVSTVFVVESPGTTPIRTDSECKFNDAIEYDYSRKTTRGTDYRLELCFTAHRYPRGMLIPFKRDSDGSMWGDDRYATEVSAYMRDVKMAFVPSREEEAWIDSQRWRVLWKHIESAIRWAVGGVVVIWLVTVTIGWILRGFLGVPTGSDQRPQKLP